MSVGIFGTIFRQSGLNFGIVFGQFGLKISGLFSNSPDRIFRTVFAQSGIWFEFGFDPETDVFGFCGVFWYLNNSVTNREGTKRCLILCASEILVILCVIVVKY